VEAHNRLITELFATPQQDPILERILGQREGGDAA
jgi:hypothetical protein